MSRLNRIFLKRITYQKSRVNPMLFSERGRIRVRVGGKQVVFTTSNKVITPLSGFYPEARSRGVSQGKEVQDTHLASVNELWTLLGSVITTSDPAFLFLAFSFISQTCLNQVALS